MLAAATLLFTSAWAKADTVDAPRPPPVDPDRASHPTTTPPVFSMGALAGVGFPRPLSFEVLTKLGGYVGLGVEYGLLPTVSVDGVAASAWAVVRRASSFRGAFFLGVRGGYQRIDASASVSSLSASADLSTWFGEPAHRLRVDFQPGLHHDGGRGAAPMTSSFSTTLPGRRRRRA